MELYLKQRVILYLFVIIIKFRADGVSSVQEQTYEACYGITHGDFLNLQCGTNETLYVHDVYTYAKQLSTAGTYGCVHTRLSPTYNTTECCTYVNSTEDCGMRYYGSSFVHYCVGVNTCTSQVAWNTTLGVCDQSVYFSETHYMRASYNCIPNSDILNICSSGSIQGNPVYITSTNYPGKQGDCSTTSGCACRASSSSSGMKVNVLDLRFYDYSSGNCQQQLHITDGASEFVISCTAYHAFQRTTVYTSTTSQIQIRFDNVFQYGYGSFWIEIESPNGANSISLSCASVTAAYACGATLETITTAVTTETTTITTEASASTTATTSTAQATTNTATTSTETTNTDSTNTETTNTASTTTQATTNTATTGSETTNTDSTNKETTNTAATTTAQATTNTATTVTNTDTANTAPSQSETTDTAATTTTTKTENGQATATNDLSQVALIGIICGCAVFAIFLWRTVLQAVFMTVLKYCRIHYAKKGMKQNTLTVNSKPSVPTKAKQVNAKRIRVSEIPEYDKNIQTRKKPKMSSRSTVDPERIPSAGRNVKVHDITGKSLDVQVVSVIGNNVKIKDDLHGKERWMNLSRIK